MVCKYWRSADWPEDGVLRSVLSAKGGRDRLDYQPISITRANTDHFHCMANDITMNLRWRKVLTKDNYAQVKIRARNYHEAYDFAMKNLALTPDLNYDAP